MCSCTGHICHVANLGIHSGGMFALCEASPHRRLIHDSGNRLQQHLTSTHVAACIWNRRKIGQDIRHRTAHLHHTLLPDEGRCDYCCPCSSVSVLLQPGAPCHLQGWKAPLATATDSINPGVHTKDLCCSFGWMSPRFPYMYVHALELAGGHARDGWGHTRAGWAHAPCNVNMLCTCLHQCEDVSEVFRCVQWGQLLLDWSRPAANDGH